MILAGVLLKMGTYGFVRFSLPLLPQAALEAVPWLVTLAIISIVYAALVTLVQKDMKKLIAYSSVSHLGFVMLGMFALNPLGLAGQRPPDGQPRPLHRRALPPGGASSTSGATPGTSRRSAASPSVMPVYATFTLIIFLASMGLPLLNGFVGEFMILQGAFAANRVWAYWAVSGVVLGAAYLLWLYQRVFWGKLTHEENKGLVDLNAREIATLVPLVVLCFWIGVYPKPFLEFLHKPAARVAAIVQPAKFGPQTALAASRGRDRGAARRPRPTDTCQNRRSGRPAADELVCRSAPEGRPDEGPALSQGTFPSKIRKQEEFHDEVARVPGRAGRRRPRRGRWR